MTNFKKEEHQSLKEIKKDLLKVIKYEDDVVVKVKVYDCTETGEQTYDIEIQYALDGEEYTDCYVNDYFVVALTEDHTTAEKEAVKRAKSVLKTVKGWLQYHENVKVEDGVEVYHA